MKKAISILLLVFLLLPQSAFANSWGLTGDLYSAVSDDSRWQDYSRISKQAGNVAVLGSRYHNVLTLVGADGKLQVYTKAVYQPEDKMDKKLKLTAQKNGFVLAYGESRFVFAWLDGVCKLIEADHGDIHVMRVFDYVYQATQQGETTILGWNITLDQFNINLFPQTLDEVKRVEMLQAALDSGLGVLKQANNDDLYKNLGAGTAAVYSAPDLSAWRAAKGKAAVGLRGEVWVHGEITNAQGERYFCIRYDVSQRTQRIGYIKSSAVKSGLQRYNFADDLVHVPVEVRNDTYLTDDPDVSQYAQFTLRRGEQLECLGLYDDYYAYVAYETKSGTAWGFVPLRDLALVQDEYRQVQHDVMAQLAGKWGFSAGGSLGPEYMELRADGTCTVHNVLGDDMSVVLAPYTWYVTRYNPQWNLYWSDVPYELVLISEDGRESVKGLSVDGEGAFSLINFVGGGGYERIEMLPGEEEDAIILDHDPWLDGNG